MITRIILFCERIFALFLVALLLAAPSASIAATVKILAFGDSLTAGYGLQPEEAFPAQLQKALTEKGYAVEVANAGVSGDTTAGGLARIDWALAENPQMVILELGGNDALRGVNPSVTRTNLDAMLTKLKEKNIPVLLAGMKSAMNFGASYASEFNGLFKDMADKHDVAFYPFFLEGVAMNPALNLPDGIHPNAQGIAVIVQNILPHVEDVLDDIEGARP